MAFPEAIHESHFSPPSVVIDGSSRSLLYQNSPVNPGLACRPTLLIYPRIFNPAAAAEELPSVSEQRGEQQYMNVHSDVLRQQDEKATLLVEELAKRQGYALVKRSDGSRDIYDPASERVIGRFLFNEGFAHLSDTDDTAIILPTWTILGQETVSGTVTVTSYRDPGGVPHKHTILTFEKALFRRDIPRGRYGEGEGPFFERLLSNSTVEIDAITLNMANIIRINGLRERLWEIPPNIKFAYATIIITGPAGYRVNLPFLTQ